MAILADIYWAGCYFPRP